MSKILVALALATAGCATAVPSLEGLRGEWGGQHIRLNVGETASEVELDCARGVVFPPYTVASNGRFAWRGNFTRGTGGPEQIGVDRPSIGAMYSGSVRGDRMTMVIMLDDGTSAGRYDLTRFGEPHLLRCL